MDSSIIIFFAAILIVGGMLFAIITMTKKGGSHLDIDKYRMRWLKIEQQLQRDQPASYSMTVLEADKLLDLALKERGIKGETMGERMKTAKASWSNANAVWASHKVRNRIAHEAEANVGYDEARRALAGFKQGLKDLGAI